MFVIVAVGIFIIIGVTWKRANTGARIGAILITLVFLAGHRGGGSQLGGDGGHGNRRRVPGAHNWDRKLHLGLVIKV
jgi:Na+/proline symporter